MTEEADIEQHAALAKRGFVSKEWPAWRVRVTVPAGTPTNPGNSHGGGYAKNRTALIIAENARDAYDLALVRWPGCKVYSIAHEGGDEVIWKPQ